MTARRYVRFSVVATFLTGALMPCASCYRAEVDLAPLLDDQSQPGGGLAMAAAGEAGRGGSAGGAGGDGGASGGANGTPGAGGDGTAGAGGDGIAGAAGDGAASGGAAGAPTCDSTPEVAVEYQCRRRPPSKQSCDEQDVEGWAGCYAGGCSVCTGVLIEYPHYLERHPCCEPNYTCSVHDPRRCSPLCPPPTERDKLPFCFTLAR